MFLHRPSCYEECGLEGSVGVSVPFTLRPYQACGKHQDFLGHTVRRTFQAYTFVPQLGPNH